MVLVLCISDSHVPHRVADLPPKFKEVLKPGKIHSTLCCGNVCSKEFLDYLKTITNELHVVQGDFDDFKAPESTVCITCVFSRHCAGAPRCHRATKVPDACFCPSICAPPRCCK